MLTRKMKDSGIEWIGEIPEDWEIAKMKYLGKFSASGIDKKINKNEKNIKIVNYTDVYNNNSFLLDNTIDYMNVSATEKQISQHLLKEGDLIFTPSSETIEDIGVSALVNEDLVNTAFSYHVLRFEFKREIEKSYRKYLANNSYVLQYFSSLATGTTRKILNRKDFNDLKVLIPPNEVQNKISNYLDEKIKQISLIKYKTQQSIEELKKYKQSLITEAVTKGLHPNVEMKDSGIEWIAEMPKAWDSFRIKNVLFEKNDKSKTGIEEPLSMSQVHGIIPSRNMDNIPNAASSYIGYRIVAKNDLVFNKLKAHLGVFDVSNYNGLVSPDYAVYKAKEKFSERYLKYLFKTSIMISEFIKSSRGVGAGLTRLYTSEFFNIRIPLPNLEEQRQIVSYLDEQTSRIDKLIEDKTKVIEELEDYKKSLIYEYVTGEKEV